MAKQSIKTIKEKNKITDKIISAITKRKTFLICGHKNPDEDCISAMISFALLLTKFDKFPYIYINGKIPDNMHYLLSICKYNSIKLMDSKSRLPNNVDTIIICDTAKPDQLDINTKVKKLFTKDGVLKIEIDHHIGTDSEYIGDSGYRLVTEASSTCELIGYLILKLRNKKELLDEFLISDPFSRNLILAIITGIIGDTNMGQFLKSKRERKYYDLFTAAFNDMLMKTTVKATNFTRIDEISTELQKLSKQEESCHKYIIKKKKFSNSIGYVMLNKKDMKNLCGKVDSDIMISVFKHVANELAEESGKVSLLSFYDDMSEKKLVQFKMRRSHNFKEFDLRNILDIFKISNGGGHEGAIGFRFPEGEIEDVNKYVSEIIEKLEEIIG